MSLKIEDNSALNKLTGQYIARKFQWRMLCSLVTIFVVLNYMCAFIHVVGVSGGIHNLLYFLDNNPREFADLGWFFIGIMDSAVVVVGLSYVSIFRPAATTIKAEFMDQYKKMAERRGDNTVVPTTAFDGFLVKATYPYKESGFLDRFIMSW